MITKLCICNRHSLIGISSAVMFVEVNQILVANTRVTGVRRRCRCRTENILRPTLIQLLKSSPVIKTSIKITFFNLVI